MKEQPKKEIHYGQEVWVNPTTEGLRKSECLCLNCDNLKLGWKNNCPIAQKLYKICVSEDVAMVITRCPLWKEEQTDGQIISPHEENFMKDFCPASHEADFMDSNRKPAARLVLCHDDPPCEEPLVKGHCRTCDITPDTQSKCLIPYCPKCNIRLERMECPNCKKSFEQPSL